MLTCLPFLSVSYKKNDLYFTKYRKLKMFPAQTNPMGIGESCPLFQCGGWGKRSDGIAPTARMCIACF